MDNQVQSFYIGTYTHRGSEGIYYTQFDRGARTLSPPTLVARVESPTWVTRHPTRPLLFAGVAVNQYQGAESGGVIAYTVDPSSGALNEINSQLSAGTNPCYLSVDNSGNYLLVANYGSGSIAALPIRDDVGLEPASAAVQCEGSSVHPTRQEGPHAHCVLPYPTGSHVILADLGSDCLWQFRLDTQTGALEPADMASVSVPPGTGPRHFAFHPTASFLYLLGELASTIHVFRRDDSAARLEPVAQYSSLPEDFDGDSTGAQILLSADGRFVYASNRGHDSIVIMAVDAETGRLSLVGHQSVHGQTPRNFNFDASGNFVLCANQDSDNIVVFERDGDKGTLTYVSEVATPAPVCIYPA